MKQKPRLESGSDFLRNMSVPYLKEFHAKERDPKARDRLTACILYKQGLSIRGIADEMGRCYSIIREWLLRIRDGGLRSRHDLRREGRACMLDAGQTRQLVADIEAGPERCGFETALWTSRMVRIHIRRRFGVDYSLRGVQDLLPRIGMSWTKARPRHPKSASKAAQKAFKKKPGGWYGNTQS